MHYATKSLFYSFCFLAFLWNQISIFNQHSSIFLNESRYLDTCYSFSFLKLVHIFSVNPHMGPLQVSLGRMIFDIIKFFFLYTLVLFAFGCGECILILQLFRFKDYSFIWVLFGFGNFVSYVQRFYTLLVSCYMLYYNFLEIFVFICKWMNAISCFQRIF